MPLGSALMAPERFRSMKLITRPSTVRTACAPAVTNKTVYPLFLRKVMPATKRSKVMDDMSADLVTDETHLLIQPRAIVGFSHWLLRTYEQAHRNDRVLAVVTRPDSVLTLAAARFINDARACWIVDHPDGTYDGFSGLCAHWDSLSFTYDGELHPVYLEVTVGDDQAIGVNAETTHSYSDDPQLGIFSVQVLAAAGCAPPTRFGIVEPLCDDFSPGLVTDYARKLSPPELTDHLLRERRRRADRVHSPTGRGDRMPRVLRSVPQGTDPGFHRPLSSARPQRRGHLRRDRPSVGPARPHGDPRCLHEVAPLGLAVPETTLPHTTLDTLVTKLRDQGVGEVGIIDSTPRGLGVRFQHEDAALPDLVSKRRTVLEAVLPPETVENVRPWYQQDT